ncbi:MAG: PKD domain-containing protein [Bacteroidia bacterium]
MRLLLPILFLSFLSLPLSAQIDREFWFAVPEAAVGHGDAPIYLRISAFDSRAQVMVDVPASSSFKPIRVTVNSNSSATVNLTSFKSFFELIDPNTIENNGLRIRSNQPIAVYYEIDNSLNRDIFTLKGKNGLGTHFFTPFQNVYNNANYQPLTISSIDVVATEDNTEILVKPTARLFGTGFNQVKIILNRGQTYSFRANGKRPLDHLTGTEITSNKPIAVSIKDDSVDPVGTCKDFIGDQLVPVNKLGTKHMVARGQLTSADEYFFVLATEDNTKVTVSGLNNKSLLFIDKGESQAYNMSSLDPEMYIETDKPVYVFQITGFGCELGGALIPPLECTGGKRVSFFRTSSENLFINLVVPKGNEDDFEFNGNSNIIRASGFKSVRGTDDWLVGVFAISTSVLSTGNLGIVTNDSARFQMGVINGGGSTGSKYGYFSPFASLNLGDNVSLCFGERIVLDAGYGFDSLIWNTSSTNDKILVEKPDTYFVEARTDNGCVLYDTVVVEISPKPEFSINDSIQCLNENDFNFNVFNGQSTSRYSWRLDGKSFGGSTLNYTFDSIGVKTIWLKSVTDLGCIDSASKNVVVVKNPPANVTFTNTVGCINEKLNIINSFIIDASDLTYNWNLGDGTTSTEKTVRKAYNQGGKYRVSLLVTDSNSCTDTASKSLTVVGGLGAEFNINDNEQCLNEQSFRLSAIEVPGGTYKWELGDGTTDSTQNVSHLYDSAKVYNVLLAIADSNNCTDSLFKTVEVLAPPIARIDVNDTAQCPYENDFFIEAKSLSFNGSMQHEWQLGDGTTAIGKAFTHNYPLAPDTFLLQLITLDSLTCLDTATQEIVIHAVPQAGFSVNDTNQCLEGNLFNFTNNSVISDGSLLTASWQFGQGDTSNLTSPAFIYDSAATYTVRMISSADCADTSFLDVKVYPEPKVDFTVNDSDQCLGVNQFVFQNITTLSAGSINYIWDFGDSASSTIISPSHKYKSSDTFIVTLKGETAFGCSDSLNKEIVVWADPDIKFYLNDTTQCLVNNQVIVSNNSEASNDSIKNFWSLGDGRTSTLKEPNYKYNNFGVFTVKLIGETGKGCLDSAFQNIYIYDQPAPSAGFDLNSDSAQCLKGNEFNLQNFSSIADGNLRFIWKPDDGREIESNKITLSYNYADTFSFRLIAISEFGCKDSIDRNLYVWPQVETAVSYSSPLCANDSLTIFDESKLETGSYDRMLVFRGKISYDTSITYLVEDSGYWYSYLFTTTNKGCKDTLLDTFWVNGKLQANATYKEFYNQTLSLVNTTKPYSKTKSVWAKWDNGQIDSIKPFIHQVDSNQLASAQELFVESDSGCVSSTLVYPSFAENRPKMAVVSRSEDTASLFREIYWRKDERAVAYNIYYTLDTPITLVGSTTDTFWIDSINSNNDFIANAYTVEGVDSLGQNSDTSKTAWHVVLESAQNDNSNLYSLAWMPYGKNWDTPFEYLILNYNSGNPFEVARVSESELTYTDESISITEPGNYCYRIVAISSEGYMSLSNVVCNDFIYWMPDAFSPNGDGINDEFRFFVNGLFNAEIEIYASTGQRVFSGNGEEIYWNGKMLDQDAPIGTYFWILNGNKIEKGEQVPVQLQGNLQLIR